MCFNFVLNRRFSFGESRQDSWIRQFVGFMTACSLGALINYAVTLFFMGGRFVLRPQLAALVGIAAATAFNFVASRYLVFRSSHIRPPVGHVGADEAKSKEPGPEEPRSKGPGAD
jgi:putative flippase GtrA